VNTLKFLLRKEFKQIFRDKSILRMIILMPLVQLLVMPLAADFEIKNINISVVDHDRSSYSKKLIDRIVASGYFRMNDFGNSFNHSFQQFQSDKSDLIIEIPRNFEKNLVMSKTADLFIAVNAINGTKASVGSGYLGQIISGFSNEIRQQWSVSSSSSMPVIQVESSNWFNKFLKYAWFMVPGILVSLVTMVGINMCSLNIVKEKEIGTIEQINVTPVKKYQFILAKLIPFFVVGIFVFSVGLFLIARLVYGIVPAGSYVVLYSFLSVYLIAILGIGLLISTYSTTQQQAMSLAFFCMMIFLLMSGLFTSLDSMPDWAKTIAQFNPVTYFIQVMRMVVLKGSGFVDVKQHFLAVGTMAILFNSWAVWNYRKVN
jgi:ABC-2 type transport system permease protein